MKTVAVEGLQAFVGQEVGRSDWLAIDQQRVNAFADVTLDHQYIHVDPERAARSPFGGTIAHGFLTLSLLSHFVEKCGVSIVGATSMINFGFDKVRFVYPVRVGARIRALVTLKRAEQRAPGQHLLVYAITIEIEGVEKPALVAEWLTLQMV